MTLDVLIVALCAIAIAIGVIHLLTRPSERSVSRERHPNAAPHSQRR